MAHLQAVVFFIKDAGGVSRANFGTQSRRCRCNCVTGGEARPGLVESVSSVTTPEIRNCREATKLHATGPEKGSAWRSEAEVL